MKDTVLMYHDVYKASVCESGFQTDGANHYKISDAAFEEQIKQISGLPVTLTFDDGGISFYTIIAPILEKYHLTGRFYIATNYIGTEGFMNENQIKDLHQRGHIIGSHSCSHPSDFRVIPFDARKMEWKDSVQRLSEIIGEPVREISIPNGFLQKDDMRIFEDLGITTIYTSKLGENRKKGSMLIKGRIGIDKNMSSGRVLSVLNGGFPYSKMLLKQKALSLVKLLLGNNYIKIKAKIRKIKK